MQHQAKIAVLVFALSHPLFGAKIQELSLGNYRKKIAESSCVFVNFWATWCEPCRIELPALVKYLEKNKKVTPLIIDAGFTTEGQKASQTFLDSVPVKFQTFHKTGKDDEFISGVDPKWSGSLPYSLLFSGGEKKKVWDGLLEPQELEKAVKQFCKK